MKEAFRIALLITFGFTLVFEPARLALNKLGQYVGGVGGIGGLTNQYDTGAGCLNQNIVFYNFCKAAKANFYCFVPGFFSGLTPMGFVTMVMVVIPFLVAAICVAATSFRARQVASDEISLLQEETLEENSSATIESALVVGFAKLVWFGASVLWMSVPLCYFLTSPFYYSSFSGAVLGVSLSAALPLSWHLMFVSLPSAGYLGPLLGLSRGNMSELHRFIAWSTVVFAAIHGLGEAIYLLLTGTFLSELSLPGNYPNENLLMVLGVCLLALMICIAASGLIKSVLKNWFHLFHRALAFCLLLVAGSHFWAFAILLIPASSLHAVSAALFLVGRFKALAQSSVIKFPNVVVAKLVALSILVNLTCFLLVWYGRSKYMIQESAGLMVPFIFPPLVFGCGFGLSLIMCICFLKCVATNK